MALKKSVFKTNLSKAISFEMPEFESVEAYIKVDTVQGTKNNILVQVDYLIDGQFIDKQTFAFVPSMDGGNFIKQAYAHLKTLPEFAGATDC
jgi:hypothetical protein